MTATYAQARDDILGQVYSAWAPTGWTIFFPDKEETEKPTKEPWARVTLRHADGEQATLANHGSRRRWQRSGNLFVQVFTPVGEGLSRSYDLCKILTDALEGKSTARGVWFRNVRLNEIGTSDAWYQINIEATWEYDEVK